MKSTFRDVSTSELSDETSILHRDIRLFNDSATVGDSNNLDGLNDSLVDSHASTARSYNLSSHKNNHTDVADTASSDTAIGTGKIVSTESVERDTGSPVSLQSSQASEQILAANNAMTNTMANSAVSSTAVNTESAAAVAAGFPDASNTGVPSGTVMKVFTGTYYVTQDNANISNLEVHGNIVIEADNVTMSNVKLVSNTPWHALRVMDDAKGFTLKDSEIDGAGRTVNAIYGAGTFLRNNLHDSDNGINVVGPSVIRDNYIHDFRGGKDAHYDGIEINGGGGHDISIVHNTIINQHDQTSAVMLNNEFGGLKNITIDGNYLSGGGYTIYLDGRKGGGNVDDGSIRVTNNQIGDGRWGDFAFYDDKPVVSGNVDLGAVAGSAYTGTNGDDVMPGRGVANGGDETYKGLGGNDLIKSGAGNDIVDGGAGNDTIRGQTGNDRLDGGAGNDKIFGGSGKDVIDGGTGDDRIDGGVGKDILTGGDGADKFVFHQSSLKATNADHITDFAKGDQILFDVKSGPTGALNASQFVVGDRALDADDHFIFNASDHSLYFDADGNGAGKKVLFATFDNDYTPTASDFLLF